MSLFVHKKIGLPVEMATVLKEDFSAMESRTVMMVLMKMLVVSVPNILILKLHSSLHVPYPSNSSKIKEGRY